MNKYQLLFLLLFLGCGVAKAEQTKRPNILWIITDDHRADALECYNLATRNKKESPLGYVSSPNINKLASEGVLFTNAFCNSPMCTPSRSSMQYGRYPFRSGHYKFRSHQEADFTKSTVSQILRLEGYGTAVFGKTGWGIKKHLNNKKNSETDFYDFTIEFNRDLHRQGLGSIFYSGGKFEFPDGILLPMRTEEKIIYPDGKELKYLTQLQEGEIPEIDKQNKKKVEDEFEILRAYTRINKALILGGENPYPVGKTVDGYIVEEMKRHLEHADKGYKTLANKDAKGADSDKPLFVNLGFHLPHTPVLPPKEFRDKFKKKKYEIPEFSTDELSNFPPQLVTLYNECKTDQFTDKEKLQAIQDYYAFCAYADELIGQAVQNFKNYCAKQNEPYLILFTVGDHGWHLGEQGIMAKFGPWKQSVHNAVIAVSSDKNLFPEGKIEKDYVEFVDFVPTILSAAGINVETKQYDYLDGYNLASVVDGSKKNREYAIGEVNVVCGHRAYMRTENFAFSMRTRDRWDVAHAPDLNNDVTWALTCPRPEANLALYDLRVDPSEKVNLANHHNYMALADWFRNKLGNIVLGDGRVECDWSKPNSYNISGFARGADNKKLDIPQKLIPIVSNHESVVSK